MNSYKYKYKYKFYKPVFTQLMQLNKNPGIQAFSFTQLVLLYGKISLLIRGFGVRVPGGSPVKSRLPGFGSEAFFIETSRSTSMVFLNGSKGVYLQGFRRLCISFCKSQKNTKPELPGFAACCFES